MTTDEQIEAIQRQIDSYEAAKSIYGKDFCDGAIWVLNQRIAELKRKQDRRKQPEVNY